MKYLSGFDMELRSDENTQVYECLKMVKDPVLIEKIVDLNLDDLFERGNSEAPCTVVPSAIPPPEIPAAQDNNQNQQQGD